MASGGERADHNLGIPVPLARVVVPLAGTNSPTFAFTSAEAAVAAVRRPSSRLAGIRSDTACPAIAPVASVPESPEPVHPWQGRNTVTSGRIAVQLGGRDKRGVCSELQTNAAS